jgi:hypothetical protein
MIMAVKAKKKDRKEKRSGIKVKRKGRRKAQPTGDGSVGGVFIPTKPVEGVTPIKFKKNYLRR